MILVPNITCIAGVFTMGFGIMASVITNNVSAIGALANGASATLNVTATVLTSDQQCATALRADSSPLDTNAANDSATVRMAWALFAP